MAMKYSGIFSAAFVLMTAQGFAQWNPNNTPVCIAGNDQREVRMVSDANGGAIITWVDYRIDPQKGDVMVQRLDSLGYAMWTANGVGICLDQEDQGSISMIKDGAGGAILVWNDWRNGDRDIFAQKINSSGSVVWSSDGIPVVEKSGDQHDAKLISDGAGGALVIWQDSSASSYDIYAQHINASGTQVWNSNGVVICADVNSQINSRLESDTLGGAFITWQDKRGGLDYDIYVQHLSSTGTCLWAANGIAVCNLTGNQSNPKIEPDGSGGSIIAWQDRRSGNYDIYAQRIDASGGAVWTANGVAVCTAAGSQSGLDLVVNSSIAGAVIVWKDERSGNADVYGQKVDLSGNAVWTANGVVIANAAGPEVKANVVGGGAGNTIVVWQDSTAGNWNIYTKKLDVNGNMMWAATVSATFDSQTNPKNIPDGSGGCIYAWQDKRNIADMNIYAHRLRSNGQAAVGIDELQNDQMDMSIYPNPASTQTVLNTDAEIHNGVIVVYNAMGQKVKVVESLSGNSFVLPCDDLPSGMYMVELSEEGVVKAKNTLMISR